MKKAISIIGIIIIFIIIYLLQSNFFTWFNIAGIKPNLFIILILFIGLFAGRRMGVIVGILIGIMLDILISKKIGISGIMLGLIGFLGGYFDKNFSKEGRITIMLMVIGLTFIYETGTYIISGIILSSNIEIVDFLKVILIEIVYNTILTIILYPLLQKAGYYIEDVYKGKKILTRYF